MPEGFFHCGIASAAVAVFHRISRCVRRAFLCCENRLTGRKDDYRRQWIQARLAFPARQFAIDRPGKHQSFGAGSTVRSVSDLPLPDALHSARLSAPSRAAPDGLPD